jgi:acyl carrier protein
MQSRPAVPRSREREFDLTTFDNPGSEELLDRAALPRYRLFELVKEMLAKNSIARPFSFDDQLSQAGLTSLDMVNLMLAVEAEFDITIPATDITPENFRSISTIEGVIVRIKPPSTRS